MKTYATWDSANKSSLIVLSSGDLVATSGHSGDAWEAVRSTIGKATGRWYWETTVTQINVTRGDMYGVANASVTNFDDYPAHTANGWCKLSSGFSFAGKMTNNTETAFVGGLSNGDVLGWYLDADTGTIGMILNGVDKGEMYSGLSGTIYAIFGSGTLSTGTGVVTANFGASAFVYTPPSGYNSGLYTGEDVPFSPFPSHYN